MALTPDGKVDREPVLHEVWNRQTSSRGRIRPQGLSYALAQLDRAAALMSRDHDLCQCLGW
jgi:hypothetical protein